MVNRKRKQLPLLKTEVTLPTKDRSGKEITLPKEATKIISLVPSTTEVIEDLGKTDQLIAADTQSSTMMTDLKNYHKWI